MKQLLTTLFTMLFGMTFAQTWSDDVAEIVYNKCSQCHHNGGVGPFSLVTYAETSALASFIQPAVSNDVMPPWPPENSYQTYSHDRSLTPAEKIMMLDWILNGTPEGNSASTPPPPIFPTGSILGAGDLEIQIPTYMSKATASGDDYVCFALPSGLPTDRKIKAVEVVPGNRAIVHHALIYVDPTNSSVTDTVGGDCGGPNSTAATLITGYTPGGSPMTLPATAPLKLGMTLPANSQIVFAMHYPEGSFGEYDSTKVIFHFYPPGEPGIREVSAAPIIQNWGFSLPPNQLTNVSAQYPTSGGVPADFSMLSVFPHMHLLGKSMRVYGIDPALDTIKMIWMPQWDFEWQDFYFYKNMQKLPTGSVIKADGVFDNTASNPNNPNTPPITVTAGLNTTDEMFLAYMHYMAYLPGDENYNMDSLMNLGGLGIVEQNLSNTTFSVYPNPFDEGLNIYSNDISAGDQVSIYIYNTQGRLIKRLLTNSIQNTNEFKIQWDGTGERGETISTGIYMLSININGEFSTQRIIKY